MPFIGVLTQQFLSKIFSNFLFFRISENSIFAFSFLLREFDDNITTRVQIEIFLSRSHIGQDSGFSSKIRIIPTKSGWFIQSAIKCGTTVGRCVHT